MTILHRHHRKRRSQGGDDSPANIMYVTPEFHQYIHDNPGESYANGWLVKSWDAPDFFPARGFVLHENDCWHRIQSVPVAGVPSETGAEDTSAKAVQGETLAKCPRCKGRGSVPPAPTPTLAKRQRKTLGIRLPVDADENGIEVLETLLTAARDELKAEMNWKDNVPAYYVLVAVLADWITGRGTEA